MWDAEDSRQPQADWGAEQIVGHVIDLVEGLQQIHAYGAARTPPTIGTVFLPVIETVFLPVIGTVFLPVIGTVYTRPAFSRSVEYLTPAPARRAQGWRTAT